MTNRRAREIINANQRTLGKPEIPADMDYLAAARLVGYGAVSREDAAAFLRKRATLIEDGVLMPWPVTIELTDQASGDRVYSSRGIIYRID